MSNLIRPWGELSEKEHREFNKKGITARQMQVRKFKKPKYTASESIKRFCMMCQGDPDLKGTLKVNLDHIKQMQKLELVKLSDRCVNSKCPLHAYRTGKRPWIKYPQNKHNLDKWNDENPGANTLYHDKENQ